MPVDINDVVTETTSQSWFSRLGGALTGLLIGLVMVPGSSALLFWNEGRAVQTAQSLAEGAGLVLAVERLDRANEGRLVHVAGPARIATPPRDPEFGAPAPDGTLRLARSVEMFQWKEEQESETRNKLGGGTETVTTYRYTRGWAEGRIDSSRFRQPDGHQNPTPRQTSRSFVAQGVTLNGFRLTEAQLSAIAANETLSPPGATGDSLRYIGADPANPRIGDLRITWSAARPEALSVIAAQSGDGFAPYATRAGDRLMMVEPGRRTSAEMFRAAEEGNAILTWVLRVVGAVLMFVAFALLMRPVKVLADVIPPLGWLVGFGTSLVAGVLTLLLAPSVIAIAWLFYRPLVAIGVLAAGAAAAFALTRLRRRAPVAKPA
ncbi:TMEM43 family protein [Falsiroseomonas sp.]|uniref:TMEM43 family protein n=1 Tax=Falsiroseomonas sp. TaxID=2870721 RepID=UPI003F6F080E